MRRTVLPGVAPGAARLVAGGRGLTGEPVAFEPLSLDEVTARILTVQRGTVLSLAGLDAPTLRCLLDQSSAGEDTPRVLLAPLLPAASPAQVAEEILGSLARAARQLWPLWYGDAAFGVCGNDTLGRRAADAIAHKAARRLDGVSDRWASAAARLVLEDRLPRVAGTPEQTELEQLARVIGPHGLVLVADLTGLAQEGEYGGAALAQAAALIHALEWAARHLPGGVVALFARLPPATPPFDRILHGARVVLPAGPAAQAQEQGAGQEAPWLGPWRGRPHPMSEIEQRLARMLGEDDELRSLFGFNRTVETVRGSKPKVDLLWAEGGLVVELDGYADHGTRSAFLRDRQRDYELTLSGFTVLRLANDEVVQDYWKALEKIRDMVRLRRARMM